MSKNQILFPLGRVESSIHSALLQHWPHFLTCVLIFLALFFSEFSEYMLRVDEEFAALRVNGVDGFFWISFGRWGVSIIELLIIRPLNPYFSMLLFGFFIAASFLIFCKAIRIQPSPSILASFALFSGFPTWYYIIEFKGTLIAYGVAVFFSALSGAFFVSRQRFAQLFFVLFLTAAISIYQSTVFVTLTISIAALIARKDTPPYSAFFFSLRRLAILTILSVVLYLILWKALLIWFNLEPSYINHYLALGKLLESPLGVIRKTFREAISFYSGRQAIFCGSFEFTGILFLLGSVSLVMHINQSGRSKAKDWILSLLALLILISTPFLLNLLSGGTLPARALLAVPFAYWFTVVMALQSSYVVIRLTAKTLILLVALQYFQIASFASFSQQFVAIHDQQVASQVYQRVVNQIDDFDRNKIYRIDFVGSLPFPNAASYLRGNSAVTGSSIFEWDGGSPKRAGAFMRLLGMDNFLIINNQERAKIIDRVEKMPSWPNHDSVRKIDGIIVVKFGDYPKSIHDAVDKLVK